MADLSCPAFAVVETAMTRGPIPGATAAVGAAGAEPAFACFGLLDSTSTAAPTPDTWYDLASLTKVLATIPLCLDLVQRGCLDPQAPLRDILPEVAWMQPVPNLGDATVLGLATHTSGLPAWEPLYTLGFDRETLLARVLHTPVDPGQVGRIVYSDLGLIILGHLLERLVGEPLDRQADRLYARVGLAGLLAFRPPSDVPIAPTEQCPWRGRLLRGEVHDENASALGGVAGHAGLFGTLRGVAGFASALLDGRLFPPPVLGYLAREHARNPPPGGDGERRGFGWILAYPGWSGGDLCSPRTIGHTGFTGTGLWIDLDRGRYSALLSNRVHPTRHADPTAIIRLRRAFNHAAHGG